MTNSTKWREWATDALTFPESVQIEVTNRCNSRCDMCPVHTSTRKKEDLPEELVKKIIDECVPYKHKVTQLLLHQNGEPLLIGAEKLASYVRYAKEKLPNTTVGFFTNGSLMDKKASKVILDSGVDFVTFSFDGGTKVAYENIRKGLNFEEVVNNIYGFGEMKLVKGLKKPLTQVLFIPQTRNYMSFSAFVSLFKGYPGIDMVGGGGLNNYAGQISMENRLIPMQYKGGDRLAPCWRLWTFLIIGSSGKPLLCCNDVDIPVGLGDIRTQTMKQIWNDPFGFGYYRKLALEGRIPELELCKDCDWMTTFERPEWWYKDGYERIY